MKKILLTVFFAFPLFLIAQDVELFQQFNGRLDFTAVGNTLNLAQNPNACDMLPQSSATLNLSGGQTFVSAHLYWASVGTGDFDVELNGTQVSAQRTFAHTAFGLPYFGAYADVTNIVAAAGNGSYTFSEMIIDQAVLDMYCGSTNFGGWAIYIIFSDPSLTLNQISLFDGLDSVWSGSPSLEIELTNIEVTSDQFSKIGFLAFEGDANNPINESLIINGALMSNALNPPDDAFNGTNSYTGSTILYNMDLDVYDLVGIVMPTQTTIPIELTSELDLILVNNIITSVNSELSDATMSIDN
ncbi:MAG: hypothetical protein ACI9AT_002008, partial [Ulvibacter sp.]